MIDYNKKYEKYYLTPEGRILTQITIVLPQKYSHEDKHRLDSHLSMIEDNTLGGMDYYNTDSIDGFNLHYLIVTAPFIVLSSVKDYEVRKIMNMLMVAIDILGWTENVKQIL